MKITKTNNKRVKAKPHYILEIKYMYGDADGYESTRTAIEEENIELLSITNLVCLVDGLVRAYPHGRGGGDDYSSMGCVLYNAFDKPFENQNVKDKYNPSGLYLEHLYDMYYDTQATVDSYRILHVDEDEFENVCVIEFTKEERELVDSVVNHY